MQWDIACYDFVGRPVRELPDLKMLRYRLRHDVVETDFFESRRRDHQQVVERRGVLINGQVLTHF